MTNFLFCQVFETTLIKPKSDHQLSHDCVKIKALLTLPTMPGKKKKKKRTKSSKVFFGALFVWLAGFFRQGFIRVPAAARGSENK